MDKLRGLIEVLLDPTAKVDERDDAAMDLHTFPAEEAAEQALTQIGSDPTVDYIIQASCGESLGNIWIAKDSFNKQEYLKLTPVAQQEVLSAISSKPDWFDRYDLPTLKKRIFGKKSVSDREIKETMLTLLLNPTARTEDRAGAATLLADYSDKEIEQALYAIACDETQKRNLLFICGVALARIWVAQDKLNKEHYHRLATWAYRAAKQTVYSLKPEWQKEL